MSYCLNPDCQNPHNLDGRKVCLICGSKLLLKEQYQAIKPIGEGGFGRTFLAEDAHRLNAHCVIKQFFPLPQIQSNLEVMVKATQLFEREARQLLELGEQHPQIPTLFGYFEQERRLYLVQQFIDGQDLSKELNQQGAFNEEQIRAMLNDLLPVLEFVHSHQVIHRDIKPSNILRRKVDGKYVLIDFGVAKQLTSTGMTITGTKPGTEGYAPLEQLRGSKVFPASDLYSLGVTCINLLTKAEPDELYNPMQGGWVWQSYLKQHNKSVSDNLSRVLDKMLQDFVQHRYQSAAEVLKDLLASVMLPSPTLPLKTTLSLTPPPPPPPPRASSPSVSALPVSIQAKNWQCIHTLAGHSAVVRGVAISPDGKTIASGSADKTIKLWDATNGKLISTLTGHTNWVRYVAFNPQGNILVSGSADKTIKIWNLSNGNLIRTLTGHVNGVSAIAFSPDREMIASGSDDSTVKLWNLYSGNLINTFTEHSGYVLSVAFSLDGKTLASACGDQTIRLWNVSSGKLVNNLTSHSGWVRSVAFSPDGKILASGSEDTSIKIWQPDGQLIRTFSGHLNRVTSISFSPDQQTLASGGGDNTVKIWQIDGTKRLNTLRDHSDAVWCVTFSTDGQTIASGSGDNTVKIWQCDR